MERPHKTIERINSEFRDALTDWKKNNSPESSSRINRIIDEAGGDFADFLLKIPGDILERTNGGAHATLASVLAKYGRKENGLYIIDIHGHKTVGIKAQVHHEPHYLYLKHKGDGPLYDFKPEEIVGIEVI
jgi:hypothetical protein